MEAELTLSMNLTRRAIRDDDQEFLFQLYASTRAEELAVTGWSSDQKTSFLRMQFRAQTEHYQAHYSGAEFTIIEAAGVPIGRLYVARWPAEIRIVDVAVIPAYRNRGIGSWLIGEILDAAQLEHKPVTIHVEKFNPALQLYLRLGFRPKEDKGVYLLMEWTPTPSHGQ